MGPLAIAGISAGASLLGQGISTIFGNKKKEEAHDKLMRSLKESMYDSSEIENLKHNLARASNTNIAGAMNNFALESGNVMNDAAIKGAMIAPMLAQQTQEQSRIELSAIDHNKNITAKMGEASANLELSKESIDFGDVISSGVQGYGMGMQIDYYDALKENLKKEKVGPKSITNQVLTGPVIDDFLNSHFL